MTIKQAIGQLMANSEGDYIIDDDLKAFKIAISALEKQIPKEPYWRVEEGAEGWACPVCDMGVTIDGGRVCFCGSCGQAIDWSDEE